MHATTEEIQTLLERAYDQGHVLIHDVSWDTYEAFLDEVGDRRIFINYDRGELEAMAPSLLHDKDKSFIARMLETMALELDIEIECFGSATWKRRDLARGIEPDECYYVKNADKVLNKEIDLDTDPPPDLAVEIDVRRSTLDRASIYAALGVAELWRYDKDSLKFFHLQKNGTYKQSEYSLNFPKLQSSEFERFLKMRATRRPNQVLRLFLQWVRETQK